MEGRSYSLQSADAPVLDRDDDVTVSCSDPHDEIAGTRMVDDVVDHPGHGVLQNRPGGIPDRLHRFVAKQVAPYTMLLEVGHVPPVRPELGRHVVSTATRPARLSSAGSDERGENGVRRLARHAGVAGEFAARQAPVHGQEMERLLLYVCTFHPPIMRINV